MIVSKSKGFKKYNKNNIVSVTLTMIFLSVIIAVFLSMFMAFFFRYVVASGIMAEYDTVTYMGQMYEEFGSDVDRAFKILDSKGRNYYLTDSSGGIIHQNGMNTCAEEGELVLVSSSEDSIYLYPDTENGFIRPADGKVLFDYRGFVRWLTTTKRLKVIRGEDESIDLPMWVRCDIKDGREFLYCQIFLHLDIEDMIFLIVFIVTVGTLTVIGFVMLLIHLFRSIYRKHRLTNLFYMDEVTGGRNWMWFTTRCEQILTRRKNATTNFAILNLTFVKYANFCVVHSLKEGEELLRRMENFISRNLYSGELIAHHGSGDFAILMKYSNETELKGRIDNIVQGLKGIDNNHRFAFHVGIDLLGISRDANARPTRRRFVDVEHEYNNACVARATLESNDDSAVAIFDSKLVEEQKWIDLVQEKQQTALVNEEFLVYYQPKYDPQSEELKGAEALIRWNSPDYGFKGPGEFIPIFERNGFITEIDHYMVSHVARDQKRWLDMGCRCVPVSVNISRAHFIEEDLAEQIRDLVDAEGAPHDLIELELTESAFFDDKNALVSTIRKLKEYGFTVSMDDFGSGYSSLNSLKDIPLDVLKLDAEFFRGDADDERREIVVSEAIRLAKQLNMRTVAEGVEIKEQVDFLAGQGCDMIQGYYFAKPLPVSEYEERIS